MILVAMPETPPPLDASIVLSSRLTVVVSQCENSKLLDGTLITFSRLSLVNSSAEKLPHSVSVTVEVDEIVGKIKHCANSFLTIKLGNTIQHSIRQAGRS
jgi:hypothetical protein